MIKTILVPAAGDDSDVSAFAAGLAVARLFGAHLDALHVRLDAARVAMAVAMDSANGAATAGLIEQLEQDAREREATAHTMFRRFCSDAGLTLADTPPPSDSGSSAGVLSAAWHVQIGDESRWMATYGLASDLIVAQRSRGNEVSARSVLEAVLLDTGRPLLISPNSGALPADFGRIAIAWKATPQTARAIGLAMPFLVRAKEIVVLIVTEGADEAPDRTEDLLLRNLTRHGLLATSARFASAPESRGGAAGALLAAARERSDLLVMGGYGHSRMREWVFGGVARRVLNDAPIPVLIAH
jgi:nucleotide-binding universal stress UspA family protein